MSRSRWIDLPSEGSLRTRRVVYGCYPWVRLIPTNCPQTRVAKPAKDGGYGIRPISSLLILKQLMETIYPGQHVKPCDYFDLIGGSSTGG